RRDLDGAFRLEAQLNLIAQRPVPAARERMAGYVDRIRPNSPSGRLAAALAAEWHAFDGTAADATAWARQAPAHGGRIFAEQPGLLPPGRPVLALVLADELAEAQRAAEQALAFAQQRGATPEIVAARWMSGMVAWAGGDLAAAEADARHALDAARLGRLRFAE